MGHLVNPIGFRLGFFDSWVWNDFWCVKHIYYSEHLYNIYSIREMLHWLFSGHTFFRLGFLYSHFSIHMSCNKYYVYVFMYDGTAETALDESLAEFLLEESENNKFAMFSDQHEMVSCVMSRFFNIFVGNMCYYLRRSIYTWVYSEDMVVYGMPHLYDYQESVVVGEVYSLGMIGTSRFNIISFSSSYMFLRNILEDSLLPLWQSLFLFNVFLGSDFLAGLSVYVTWGCQEPFFEYVSSWVEESFLNPFSLLSTSVTFLGMSNSEVTSFMLTSYMGIKLYKGVTIWDLVTPLRREFNFLGELSRGELLGFKFHFRGRFSRNQSASSIWVVSGSLPLSSMGFYIDYSFAEVPMINSICSLNVWLYSSECSSGYTYSLNFSKFDLSS